MVVQYRVTFLDVMHGLRRTMDLKASNPLEAAKKALQWQLNQARFLSDFGPSVEVEVVTTTALNLPLGEVLKAGIMVG